MSFSKYQFLIYKKMNVRNAILFLEISYMLLANERKKTKNRHVEKH